MNLSKALHLNRYDYGMVSSSKDLNNTILTIIFSIGITSWMRNTFETSYIQNSYVHNLLPLWKMCNKENKFFQS